MVKIFPYNTFSILPKLCQFGHNIGVNCKFFSWNQYDFLILDKTLHGLSYDVKYNEKYAPFKSLSFSYFLQSKKTHILTFFLHSKYALSYNTTITL